MDTILLWGFVILGFLLWIALDLFLLFGFGEARDGKMFFNERTVEFLATSWRKPFTLAVLFPVYIVWFVQNAPEVVSKLTKRPHLH